MKLGKLDDILENNREKSAAAEYILYLRDLAKDKNKKRWQWIVLLIAVMYLVGLLLEMPLVVSEELAGFTLNPIAAFYAWFRMMGVGLFLTIVIFMFALYVRMVLSRLLGQTSEYELDEARNVKVATKDNTYGSQHWMNEREQEKALDRDKDADNIDGCILGVTKEELVCSRKQIPFTNDNVCIIGPPGIGKSVCLVNNDILQYIKQKQSFVAIDTKGGVYSDTCYVAEENDYDIKIFNIKPDEVEFSDACNFMDCITDRKNSVRQAASITNTIIYNLYNPDKKDIWAIGAYNLLMAMILIVKYDNTLEDSQKNLATVYENLIDHSELEDLLETYSYINDDKTHPAYVPWRTFCGSRDVVQESVLGGLITNLNIFADELTRQIVSNNEISFTAPGEHPCAYYIVISDEDKSTCVLAALFIQELFIQLTSYADSLPDRKLPVKVNFEIDEFYQVGRLPDFVQKLSSARSRNIAIKFVIQDNSQLEEMYPQPLWRTILADCTTLVVLGVGEKETAKYIAERMGEQTYVIENRAVKKSVTDPIDAHADWRASMGKGARKLMTAEEIMGEGEFGLKDTELIVIMRGQPPLLLNKFMWWLHPWYVKYGLKEGFDDGSKVRRTVDHEPEWAKSYVMSYEREQEEAERKRQEIAAKRNGSPADDNSADGPSGGRNNSGNGTKKVKLGLKKASLGKKNGDKNAKAEEDKLRNATQEDVDQTPVVKM